MQLGKKIGQVWQPRAPVALKYGGKVVGVLNSGTVSALVHTARRCGIVSGVEDLEFTVATDAAPPAPGLVKLKVPVPGPANAAHEMRRLAESFDMPGWERFVAMLAGLQAGVPVQVGDGPGPGAGAPIASSTSISEAGEGTSAAGADTDLGLSGLSMPGDAPSAASLHPTLSVTLTESRDLCIFEFSLAAMAGGASLATPGACATFKWRLGPASWSDLCPWAVACRASCCPPRPRVLRRRCPSSLLGFVPCERDRVLPGGRRPPGPACV